MTSSYFSHSLRFILLILLQVVLCSQLNFAGFINPMVYLLFLFWYPIRDNQILLLVLSFIMGLIIDIFLDTLALHAAALLITAYFRMPIMRFVFGVNLEFQNFKISNATVVQQITFLALLILVHHLSFFVLEIFSFSNLLLILKKVFFTGIGTFILSMMLVALFGRAKA